MKASLSDKLFFCAAALALGILIETTAQAQMGGVPLWTNRFNGPANSDDRASAIAVDGSDNVFVTGSAAGSGSGLDYATIKYSATGIPLWTNVYNGPANGNDQAIAMAADSSGNVLVAGSSAGSG